jgi:hypothetical protein
MGARAPHAQHQCRETSERQRRRAPEEAEPGAADADLLGAGCLSLIVASTDIPPVRADPTTRAAASARKTMLSEVVQFQVMPRLRRRNSRNSMANATIMTGPTKKSRQ